MTGAGKGFKTILCASALWVVSHVQPALAQLSGDSPSYVTASYAQRLARYYAPYAIQAAAAYVDVARFDARLGPFKQPPTDGSDVALAVEAYSSNPLIAERATKYLRAWQYQFGSEGYLRCLDNDSECERRMTADRWTLAVSGGPAFHVWARTRHPQRERASCSEVSIAFRGTVLSSADWISNFDPVTGYFADDHYRQLRRNIDPIIKRITSLDCYKRAKSRPQIVSVGHSLGGGLAQLAALANNPGRPRIAKVFAFDPSPITGAPLVDRHVLSQNAEGLEIDLIYQTGEVLQRVRRLAQQFPKSSSRCVRTIVFDAIQPTGSVTLHNMAGLAREMIQLSYDGNEQYAFRVPSPTSCPARYRPPKTDDYESPNSDREPGELAYRPNGYQGALARADWRGAAFLQSPKWDGAERRAGQMNVHNMGKIARAQAQQNTQTVGDRHTSDR